MGGLSDTDLVVAALADAQHGVVARSHLLQAGVSARALERRAENGRLRRLYRGVYAVGHTTLTLHGRWLAATLACGPSAALSHPTAAAAWDLRRAGEAIHITVPAAAAARPRAGPGSIAARHSPGET